MLLAEVVVDLELRRPGRLLHVGGGSPLRNLGKALVEVTGVIDVRRRPCRDFRADGDHEILGLSGSIEHEPAADVTRLPTLNAHAVSGIHERALIVYAEISGAGKEGLVAGLHDEEAVTLNRHIRLNAGGLERPLRMYGVDARDTHAEPDFLRVDAAELVSRLRRP